MADEQILNFGDAERELNRIINQLKKTDQVVVQISQNALTIGRNLSSINLPSDLSALTSENARLTAQIQAQAAALAKLQSQYTNLAQKQSKRTQQSAQEAYNQSLLNRNAMEAARINSTLAGAYSRLSAEQGKAARTLQDLIARGRLATQTQRQYNRELDNAQREFDELNRRVLAADRAVGRFNRNVGNYPIQAVKGLKDLLAAFGVVGGLQLAAQIAKDIIETTKEIQSMDMALKQVTQTQEAYAQSQMFLSRVAEAYGADLSKLTTQFTQFYVSAKDKISASQIEDIFESITKAGATMGLSTEKQERAFLALNQMMSKGTIQAEELRGQLGEALPGALGIMAKALGVSEKELAKMMKNGELLASEVLPKFAHQLEITYGIENVNRVETLAAAQTRYTNAWRDFVRGLDEDGNKLSNFMKKAIGVGTDLLVGINRLLESSQSERNRILKTLQEGGYNQTLSYYKSLDELNKEDLKNDKAYTLEKVRQETEEFNRLKNRNLILKALIRDTPLGQVETSENKTERLANEKSMKEINNLLSRRKGQVQAINKLLDEGNHKTETTTELTKEQLKAIEDNLKALALANRKEIELRILKNETILNGEYATHNEQYAALNKYLSDKLLLIQLDYNEQVRLAKGNANKIKVAEYDRQMAIIKQEQDGFNKLKTIRKKQNDEYISEIKDVEEFLKDYHEKEDLREESSLELKQKVDKAENDLYDKKIARLKELKDATKEYQDSFVGEFFSNAGFGESFETFFKQVEDGLGGMTTKFNQLLEGADGKNKWKVYFNSIAQSAQEAFNFISQLTTKNFDDEKERLQSQYDVSLKYAGDNKEAQEKLAEDLEKRKKEIAYREAKAKQKQALFNIAIDTAQAVVSVLPNFVLAGIVAALGLAQAVAVSSQEIPQYWMGGTHDGGLMMINDGKGSDYKEYVRTPDGKVSQYEGRNVIMDAPAGTEIFTQKQWDNELQNMLRGKGIEMSNKHVNYYGITRDEMYDIMNETLGNQPVQNTVFDETGVSNFVNRRGNITRQNIRRGNGRGQRF